MSRRQRPAMTTKRPGSFLIVMVLEFATLVQMTGLLSNQTQVRLERLRKRLRTSDQDVCHSKPTPTKRRAPRGRRPQRRLTQEQLTAVLAAFLGGAPVKDLARQFGVHHSTIQDHLNRPPRARRTPALDEAMLSQAIKLYASGLSFRTVGRQLGVHAATVRDYLLKAGIQPRDHAGK